MIDRWGWVPRRHRSPVRLQAAAPPVPPHPVAAPAPLMTSQPAAKPPAIEPVTFVGRLPFGMAAYPGCPPPPQAWFSGPINGDPLPCDGDDGGDSE